MGGSFENEEEFEGYFAPVDTDQVRLCAVIVL